jgi:vacuolar-type H+-ATPase subunit I/STV1
MEKLIQLIKYFPLMPAAKETGKLILAIAFYLIVPGIVASIVDGILIITLILSPLAAIVSLLGTVYTVLGIIFAVMSYMGKDVTAEVTNLLAPKKTEE